VLWPITAVVKLFCLDRFVILYIYLHHQPPERIHKMAKDTTIRQQPQIQIDQTQPADGAQQPSPDQLVKELLEKPAAGEQKIKACW
jgi:hypothetical protein